MISMKLLKFEKTRDTKYLKNYTLTYENKNGREKQYEMVSRNDLNGPEDIGSKVNGISIVAMCNGKMMLLREFRMAVNRHMFNLVAGMKEPDETIEECMKRELYEETGLKVTKVIDILEPCYSAVAISDIKTQIAFVVVDGNIEDHTSENEDIKAAFYSKEEIKEMLKTEEFSSRAQVCAYFFAGGFFDRYIDG